MATATKRRTKRGSSRSAKAGPISAHWRQLMGLIPGYDPIATAPPGCRFDETAAQDAIDFFHTCLRHVKGHKGGQLFLLEPWQQAVTGCIFGWKRPDGLRRYQEVWYYVPRKNGKSPWAGGIILYLMTNDPEPGIEAYSGACDRDQAALVYQYVQGMILQEPFLKARLKVYATTKVVEFPTRFAYYKVLSGIPESKHGLNVHCAVIDETHAHKTPDLIDVLSTGTAARKQPLIIHTTTADWLRDSVCNEKYDYACKVRDGVITDPAFLPVIYEAHPPKDEEADPLWWTREAIWKHANPNYDVSVESDFLRRECQRALDTPRFRNTFKRLHLNIRTGQDTVWFGLEAWDACYAPDFDWDSLAGQSCFAGLDLASTSDLCAFVLYFPETHAVLPYFWLPHETIAARYTRAGVPYPTWAEDGHLRVTSGNVTDYDRIRQDIIALGAQYQMREIAIDRWNSLQLQTQLTGAGFTVVPFGQGFASMSAPSKELERLITSKLLRHDGHPVMRWMASHVAVEEDAAGNLKPAKNKSAEKIDGMVSLAMSIGRALVAEPVQGPSVYERRGALLF
jgi:phage terminase large subunit-like protein